MKSLYDGLAKLRHARRRHVARSLAALVKSVSPSPSALRDYARLVNLDEIRKVNDPVVLAERFHTLEAALLTWAGALEVFYAQEDREE